MIKFYSSVKLNLDLEPISILNQQQTIQNTPNQEAVFWGKKKKDLTCITSEVHVVEMIEFILKEGCKILNIYITVRSKSN